MQRGFCAGTLALGPPRTLHASPSHACPSRRYLELAHTSVSCDWEAVYRATFADLVRFLHRKV
ncbi:MAG: hypothetical protein R3223_13195, partial [Longimicrobiales bacterium]|nr:hypothetical protein [Longimicrobiales bacterium]